MSNEPIYSFAVLHNRLTVTGILEAETALRIGAGRQSEVGATDLPVLRDSRGYPLIPGASIKGALRAQIEALVRSILPAQAHDLSELEAFQRMEIPKIKASFSNDRALSDAIIKASTLMDLTFGAPWIAGRLFLRDAAVRNDIWFSQYEIRNGIGIDRDSETVSEGLLYNYEVVPAGTQFDFALTLENAADWQLGMITLALQPWERGEVQIGGFRSRGLGHIRLAEADYRYTAIDGADSIIELLRDGGGAAPDDITRERWYKAFVAVLRDPASATKEAALA